ncbi:MAG: hypothetical protein HOP91_04425 [Sphingomonas sp.]|nr:hypothetical protein [Sphingomonas sp.]
MMVVMIVAIVMFASIIKARVRGPNQRCDRFVVDDSQAQVENKRLRDEVSELKERIKVLERITVDKENSLAKEIESLRDR